ncbi:acyl-CoA synthetase (AMP-forming)/AMP-acid ligase II [Streptomyces sp. TLI_235]|nr:AMP-binding protein [Streptomyces sp. TLI_235]PBC66211.1 acyl-CoA synthetase (AMP-forming)/AMP-acid ligase II [Streptomyces sp. TLI_235]
MTPTAETPAGEQPGSGPTGTVRDWLRHHADRRPDEVAVTALDGGSERGRLTYRDWAALADRAGAAMRAHGARTGDRVLLALPNDESFPAALVAAVGAGLVAVPVPAIEGGRVESARERLLGIVADCRPALLVAPEPRIAGFRSLLGPSGPRCVAWQELAEGRTGPPGPDVERAEIAVLQYTSGSTGHPKGVALTHRSLRASCAQAGLAYRESPADVAVTWVPLHHDMGLVTAVLRPLFTGYRSVLLSPREFVRSPGSWLAAITAHGGTLSSAPDFGYALCARRVPEAELSGYDLAGWRVARNAGEVVRAETVERFTARFAPAGLRADAVLPSYGLAEATLTVTACTTQRPPLVLRVDRERLARGEVAPARDGAVAVRLLSSGVPLPGTRVAIRGADGRGRLGEVQVDGPQLFAGYWPGRRDGGPHPTGDLGFLHRGHLFVVGRADDVVVHHGRNFHPPDIAAACAEVAGVRAGRCSAFLLPDGDVCVVAELADPAGRPPRAVTAVEAQVRRALARTLGLYVAQVVLVPAGTLPVTTSGKVRTAETARRHRRGLLPVPTGSPRPGEEGRAHR